MAGVSMLEGLEYYYLVSVCHLSLRWVHSSHFPKMMAIQKIDKHDLMVSLYQVANCTHYHMDPSIHERQTILLPLVKELYLIVQKEL